ncbi:hypothetical protein [Butyrivibrio sp. MC2013]|uniref:hypothetical protein n=1 Tax=Butyrivibrio sp. MC2013 TaxID=1280686 RepID=UPI001FA70B93|nr:hypothetical protein [Butyrivibrio sp. MC2013]
MIIKIIISEYNYTTIPTSEVKKGMIISSFSSIVMSNSKIKGLPQISHEDMRSRLTQEEADAIIQWGKTKGSLKTIQIVRKMPFAIFIFLGLLIYSTIWGISN